ncbi:YbaB/EbfC family nucleoid-associated protein [Actinosynnema sp. ALI-1.44]|uniref:YbaB/EbfC family nucleoid-associated protein n=1 Tax=Actinosynnema sp. ALI-1.44 TaxID=1933779 RepID=UPI001EDA6A44|nr:YbaB/EbfC family nucleoid-associated protein [Actinosynnema sp. ALI-1.44]
MADWSATGADPDRAMAKALASFEAESRKLEELGKHWEEASTTVRAKDHSLEVTVDGRGELVDLVFNGAKYRKLAPAQLARMIIETLQAARTQAMAKMSDLMGASGIPGLDMNGLVSGKLKPEEMLNALVGPMLDTLEGFGVESPLPRPADRDRKEQGGG